MNCYERFFGIFSATFGQYRLFSSHQFFPAKKYLLGSVLSYLAENSAILQQCSKSRHGSLLVQIARIYCAVFEAYTFLLFLKCSFHPDTTVCHVLV
jgi:hypothetical protein